MSISCALFDWFTSAKSRRMCTKAAQLNDAKTATARDEGKSSLHPCKFFPGSKTGRECGAHAMTTLRHTTRLCKPRSVLCKTLANNENDVSKSAASIDRQRQCCRDKSRTFRYFHGQQRPVRYRQDIFSPSKQCRHATGGDDKLNFVSGQFTNVCRRPNVGLNT